MSNIKILREKSGFTKVKLAQQTRISRQYLAKIERGDAIPSVIIASSLAKNLNCTMEELEINTNKDVPGKGGGGEGERG